MRGLGSRFSVLFGVTLVARFLGWGFQGVMKGSLRLLMDMRFRVAIKAISGMTRS